MFKENSRVCALVARSPAYHERLAFRWRRRVFALRSKMRATYHSDTALSLALVIWVALLDTREESCVVKIKEASTRLRDK